MNILYIAWRYIAYNKAKSLTLITCISLIGFIPLALEALLDKTEQQFLSRSNSTPLLLGKKGSALDLTMSTLYFSDATPEYISIQALNEVSAYDLAKTIPIYVRFNAREFPIVGTSIEYFKFRNLSLQSGRLFAVLGECVIGSKVADKLGLKINDHIISSPENAFDLAGIYPLKMKVVGIVNQSFTADDLAVFADLKTTWVIQGLGHGHEDLNKIEDNNLIINRDDKNIIANAKVVQFNEITDSNIGQFHFHGDLGNYPISSIILVPNGEKASALLQGKYIEKDSLYQSIRPTKVVQSLLKNIFQIQNVINIIILIVGISTSLAISLVFILSIRLRQQEIKTITYLGCNKLTVASLLISEIVIIILTSALICVISLYVLNHFSHDLVRILFVQ